jgi:hypothetical protein
MEQTFIMIKPDGVQRGLVIFAPVRLFPVFFSREEFGDLVNLGGLMFICLQETWFGLGLVASCLAVLLYY